MASVEGIVTDKNEPGVSSKGATTPAKLSLDLYSPHGDWYGPKGAKAQIAWWPHRTTGLLHNSWTEVASKLTPGQRVRVVCEDTGSEYQGVPQYSKATEVHILDAEPSVDMPVSRPSPLNEGDARSVSIIDQCLTKVAAKIYLAYGDGDNAIDEQEAARRAIALWEGIRARHTVQTPELPSDEESIEVIL